MNAATDHDAGVATLRDGAAKGASNARFRFASVLMERGQPDKAFDLYRLAAEAGHGDAQLECARMLLYGVVGDPDPEQAVEWLRRAEESGRPAASYYLATIALGNTALSRDDRVGRRIQAAVDADFPPALRAAAIHFGRRNNDHDQALCLQLLDRGARRGDAVAALLLAERLYRGEGCEIELTGARKLWRRLGEHGITRLPELRVPLPGAAAPRRRPHEAAAAAALDFGDALQPPAWKMLSGRPRVMRIGQLLSADECRMLVAIAQLQTRPRRAGDPDAQGDVWFDPQLDDFAVRLVQLRLARAARTDLSQTEALVVQRQRAGQPGRPLGVGAPPVRSGAPPSPPGERQRAICVQLVPADAGGALECVGLNPAIALSAGDAVMFDAAPDDGAPMPGARPAVQAVQRGEQWLATLWLRHRACRSY